MVPYTIVAGHLSNNLSTHWPFLLNNATSTWDILISTTRLLVKHSLSLMGWIFVMPWLYIVTEMLVPYFSFILRTSSILIVLSHGALTRPITITYEQWVEALDMPHRDANLFHIHN